MENLTGEELFSAFRSTAGKMRREVTALKAGVGGAEFLRGQGRLMRRLLVCDGASPKELAQDMDIRPASLSELLAKLEAKGLVERTPNEADRRGVYLRLTPAGRKQAEALEKAKAAYARQLFTVLDAGEKAQLAAILAKLDAQMERTV